MLESACAAAWPESSSGATAPDSSEWLLDQASMRGYDPAPLRPARRDTAIRRGHLGLSNPDH
jgi:hypothetical protein